MLLILDCRRSIKCMCIVVMNQHNIGTERLFKNLCDLITCKNVSRNDCGYKNSFLCSFVCDSKI